MAEQRLTFLQNTGGKSADGHILAEYQCECGNKTVVRRSRVKNGYTRSCGCLALENKPGFRHGGRRTPEYASWSSMRDRCLNTNSKDYPRWGGRGIAICERWNDFSNFLEDMGDRPVGMTLDRIESDGDYEPSNCRWATPREQARNRKDLTIVKTPQGTMPLVDYADILGISKGAAHLRLSRGRLEGVSHA